MAVIQQRKRVRVPTPGSQHRCYNGCFPSSDWEIIWTAWEDFDSDATEKRLTFWRELNDYAVSQRGQSAKCEYRLQIGDNHV